MDTKKYCMSEHSIAIANILAQILVAQVIFLYGW